MKTNDVRKRMYLFAKILGDVNTVNKGKVGERVQRRVVGKMAGRTLWGKWFK